jgi:hypothetical protein
VALFLSVFVVYMNTVTALNQPPVPITNPLHVRFMELHQNVGLIYFGLMTAELYRCRRATGIARHPRLWMGWAAG